MKRKMTDFVRGAKCGSRDLKGLSGSRSTAAFAPAAWVSSRHSALKAIAPNPVPIWPRKRRREQLHGAANMREAYQDFGARPAAFWKSFATRPRQGALWFTTAQLQN